MEMFEITHHGDEKMIMSEREQMTKNYLINAIIPRNTKFRTSKDIMQMVKVNYKLPHLLGARGQTERFKNFRKQRNAEKIICKIYC